MSLILDRFPALTSRFTRKSGKAASKPGLRPDIQGLRAFAVIAVILDHSLGWPSGGFVGVDIFFVISGFLITGLLLREQERSGRISFTGFYKRRVKRILPAAALVLAVTAAASFFIFNQVRAVNTAWDAVWALFFGANWRQAIIGTDYFQASGPVSPLQHYWSLAVEEQFYFVWPWLMVLLFLLTAKLFKGRVQARTVAGVALAILTVASFAWSVYDTSTDPTVAYFSTFARAWELGVGGILACMATVLPRIPQVGRPFLAWAGLAGMVASLFVTDAHAGFPGPGAALPVLSSAAIIAAGTGALQYRYIAPLSNRTAAYIGDISYSLYLWHFPIIIFAASLVPDTTPTYFAIVLAAVALISVYSYHLLEDPIRKSSWLTDHPRKRKREGQGLGDRYWLIALSALAVVSAVVVVMALVPQQSSGTAAAADAWNKKVQNPTAAAASKAVAETVYGPKVTQLQKELVQATTKTEWPALSPSVDDVLRHNPEPDGVNKCGSQTGDRSDCVWGNPDAPKKAVVVGDSIAIAWMPALIKLYGTGDWSLRMESKYGCPFTSRAAQFDSADCTTHKAATVKFLQQSPPDLLIVANNYPDTADANVWSSELTGLISKTSSAAKTVALAPPPHNKDIRGCYRPGSTPLDCTTTLTGWYGTLTAAERNVVEGIGGKYVDTEPLFCVNKTTCPAFAGSTVMKIDDTHPSAYYVEKVTPALGELIAQAQAAKKK